MMSLMFDIPIKRPSEDAGELSDIQVWTPRTKIRIREKTRKSCFTEMGFKVFRQDGITQD